MPCTEYHHANQEWDIVIKVLKITFDIYFKRVHAKIVEKLKTENLLEYKD